LVWKVAVIGGDQVVVIADLEKLKAGHYIPEVFTKDGKVSHQVSKQ